MHSSVRSAVGRFVRLAPGLAFAALLSGCGDTSIGSSFMNWMPKMASSDQPADGKDLSKFAPRPTCPGAEIRYGTESANIYESGKQNNPDALKFQLSVQRVARECDEVGPSIVARVGAAGRVVAGPKGATGKVDIPVRIAAVNGDKVLYTGLKVVSVEVQAPDFGANWSLVDESVTIPSDQSADTVIYVGIDDKARPAPKAEKQDAKPRVHKPRAPAASANDPYPQMKPNIPQ
jgi:hypothetical protein